MLKDKVCTVGNIPIATPNDVCGYLDHVPGPPATAHVDSITISIPFHQNIGKPYLDREDENVSKNARLSECILEDCLLQCDEDQP